MKRAKILIRLQGEVQPQSSEDVATIESKTKTDIVDKGINITETPFQKEVIDEIARVITEKMGLINIPEKS